jgi:hypothetical protein
MPTHSALAFAACENSILTDRNCRLFLILTRMLTRKCIQSKRNLMYFERFHFVDSALVAFRAAEASLQERLN